MKQALEAFKKVLESSEHPKQSVALGEAGWEELMPLPETWSFTHPDFPGVIIDWLPNREPSVHKA